MNWYTQQQKQLRKDVVLKRKTNRTNHKQPTWKCKIQKEIEAFKRELSILEDLSKGVNVKTRKRREVEVKYKL